MSRNKPRPHRVALPSCPLFLVSVRVQTRVFSLTDAHRARKDATDPEPPTDESEPEEEVDPWDLPELRDTGVKWSGKCNSANEARARATLLRVTLFVCVCSADLDTKGKVLRVLKSIVKFILLLGLLYVFVCSLDILSSAFQLVGGAVNFLELPLNLTTFFNEKWFCCCSSFRTLGLC